MPELKPKKGASKASPVSLSDRFAFTSWILPQCNMKLVKFMIYQQEICPNTKLLHYQGYVEFKREYSFGQVKQIFRQKEMHVEIARESRLHNINYCHKIATATGKRFLFNDDFKNELEDVFNLNTIASQDA